MSARPQGPRRPGGIVECYGYAYACGTGQGPDRVMGADDLRKHSSVRGTTTYRNPADARYQPGDWIVTSSGHAGYVNKYGRIDHYLQVPGEIGKFRPDYNVLPPTIPGRKGGLAKNQSMEEFLNAGYRRQLGVSVDVLRRR